jgi:hypothetical protein
MRQINQRFLTMIFACVLLSLMPLACATTQEKPEAGPAASLIVTPNSGLPKDKITILGSGFIPGETIEVIIVVDGVPTELGEKPMVKKANAMGAFKTSSNIPWMATPGVYTIKATGDKGTVAVAPLDVAEKPKKK